MVVPAITGIASSPIAICSYSVLTIDIGTSFLKVGMRFENTDRFPSAFLAPNKKPSLNEKWVNSLALYSLAFRGEKRLSYLMI